MPRKLTDVWEIRGIWVKTKEDRRISEFSVEENAKMFLRDFKKHWVSAEYKDIRIVPTRKYIREAFDFFDF